MWASHNCANVYKSTTPPHFLGLPSAHDCTGSHRSNTKASVTFQVKYCSQRCRKHKLGKLDYQIESTFVSLPNESNLPPASTPTLKKEKKIKGDPIILISCSPIQAAVFGDPREPEENFGRKRNKARRGIANSEEWRSRYGGRTSYPSRRSLGRTTALLYWRRRKSPAATNPV